MVWLLAVTLSLLFFRANLSGAAGIASREFWDDIDLLDATTSSNLFSRLGTFRSGESYSRNRKITTIATVDSRLRAWYPLKVDAKDYSGNNDHGVLSNGAAITCGYLNLDKSQAQYVNLPARLGSAVGQMVSYSFTAWINYRSYSTWSRILEFSIGPSKARLEFVGSVNSKNDVLVGVIICNSANTCERYLVAAAAYFYTGKWYHIAFTYDGSTKVGRLYKDGVMLLEQAYTGIQLNPDVGPTVNNFIGKSQFASDATFDGWMSDVRIYNATLSGYDVQQLASLPVSYTCLNPAGVKALYPLQTDARDISGSNLHGTLMNGPSFSCGYMNLMKAKTHYVDMGSGVGLVIGQLTSYSFTAWINYRSYTAWTRYGLLHGNAFTVAVYYAWHGYSFDQQRILNFGFPNTDKPTIILSNTALVSEIGVVLISSANVRDTWLISTSTFPTDTWHHIAFTFDYLTRTGKLYKNGRELLSETGLAGFNPKLIVGNTTRNYIGNSQVSGDKSYDGFMSDVRIYDKSLSASEVQAVAAIPVESKCNFGLVAWYPLKNNSNDYSGYGADGTVNGGASTACGVLKLSPITQKQYVGLGANIGNVVAGLSSFSVAAWVYYSSYKDWGRVINLSVGLDKARVEFHTFNKLGGGQVALCITANNNTQDFYGVPTASNFPLNTWHHIAITFDSTIEKGKARIYKNGVLLSEQNGVYGYTPANVVGVTVDNFIGLRDPAADQLSWAFDGFISDVRLYGRVLPVLEVADLAKIAPVSDCITSQPTTAPSTRPSFQPSSKPSMLPTKVPSARPTQQPTINDPLSGGTRSVLSSGILVRTFNTSGTVVFTRPTVVDFLLIAGGGGGGSSADRTGGGGGAGGVIYMQSVLFASGSYTVTIGSGGASGRSGSNSTFSSYTAVGGGYGSSGTGAGNGGSGGGVYHGDNMVGRTGGQGFSGQGNSGGSLGYNSLNPNGGFTAAGGGGAGERGSSGTSSAAGNGGNGIAISITGTLNYYAGGGAGSAQSLDGVNRPAGAGGLGGGGNGAKSTSASVAVIGGGATFFGSGGGGGASGGAGGAGYAGVLFIAYGQPTEAPTRRPSREPTSSPSTYPTTSPTGSPTEAPTDLPTSLPTETPTALPTSLPTETPTALPTSLPTETPTALPTLHPSKSPSSSPTPRPSVRPSTSPSRGPTSFPSFSPTHRPSGKPSRNPTMIPTNSPSVFPTLNPSSRPTRIPTFAPTVTPSKNPTVIPTKGPSSVPTSGPSERPTRYPTLSPTQRPSRSPSSSPTRDPSQQPSKAPTVIPTKRPSTSPTLKPSPRPTALPSKNPTAIETKRPSSVPTTGPSVRPTGSTSRPSTTTLAPSRSASQVPSNIPSRQPSKRPTNSPT